MLLVPIAAAVIGLPASAFEGPSEVRQVGPYQMQVSWYDDTSGVGTGNAVLVILTDSAGRPVNDATIGLRVDIACGEKRTGELPLTRIQDYDGGYRAFFVPEAARCTFHFTGSIRRAAVDETVSLPVPVPSGSASPSPSTAPSPARAPAGGVGPVPALGGGAGAVLAVVVAMLYTRRRRDSRRAPAAVAGPGLLAPGATFAGRYEIRRFLGEGASKRVWVARDTRLDRDVALCVIRTEGLDEAGLARVRREAQAMARLGDHPNVVTVHDSGDWDGRPYIVAQYLEGGSVEDLLGRAPGRRLPPGQALRIAREMCLALEHAHANGVVHRDLKPRNVWMTAHGTAKLGDFGLAVALDRTRLTTEARMLGTVAYMAPEQAQGHTPDARADLYSLGAMLYEMLAGRPPFVAADAMAIVYMHLNEPPKPPSLHAAGIPPAVDGLVLELLAKDPAARPTSAAQIRERIEDLIPSLGREAVPVGAPAAAGDSSIDALAVTVQREQPDLRTHASPDGTVTILFSDIEDSTVLTERYGDVRWLEIIREHNALVRERIAEHSGFEVRSQGDGFMVAFSSARRGVRCAIGIQRAITEWSAAHPDTAIRVRIGLHSGEALAEAGDFYGRHVNLAARIAGLAVAGEIVVSALTRDLCSGEDLSFGAEREVTLRGVSGTHRIVSVEWDGDG